MCVCVGVCVCACVCVFARTKRSSVMTNPLVGKFSEKGRAGKRARLGQEIALSLAGPVCLYWALQEAKLGSLQRALTR